ncbi:hypothetical protein KA012_01970, partial [Candidatus Woesebacteria bacterium]|nr:hypothetical protein [Candidatus Woesebacteria bacterium]
MSACQPLHDYFENLGCDPQQVMSILDDDFLKDYVTDPQSRAADAVILKQQVPKLIQSLSSEEFFQCYSALIRIIIEKWLARYSPNTTRNYFLSKLDINVSASQPLAHIRSNS